MPSAFAILALGGWGCGSSATAPQNESEDLLLA